jgi:EAL domain-containing protein (putative c-di-GMP-specific phosphodiesterase class I)
VLRDADVAMYEAKGRGPGHYAVFDRSMGEFLTPAAAERQLREALDRGELRLCYQPIVSLWTRRLVGVEALLRRQDPMRGLVDPTDILPTLEDSALMVPVGNWIISEVCKQSRRWQDANPDRPGLNIKVNVSARQLAQANFVQSLQENLRTSGASPDHISLEISEGALTFDVQSAWSTLREAKALGVSLALDDFGTGYSSLSYLRQYRLDLLRIDRSFVDGLGRSREDATIVEHVIAMAKALGIVTVAEGVTTEAQARQLHALNCDLAQGDLFSGPLPAEAIEALLTDGSEREWSPAGPGPERRSPGSPLSSAGRVGATEQGAGER